MGGLCHKYLQPPGLPVVRPDTVEMSAWGVAALAGIQVTWPTATPAPGRGVGRAGGGGPAQAQGDHLPPTGGQAGDRGGPVHQVGGLPGGGGHFQVERGLQEDATLAPHRGRLIGIVVSISK